MIYKMPNFTVKFYHDGYERIIHDSIEKAPKTEMEANTYAWCAIRKWFEVQNQSYPSYVSNVIYFEGLAYSWSSLPIES